MIIHNNVGQTNISINSVNQVKQEHGKKILIMS